MESFMLIKNKYDYGAYDIEDMIQLVENNVINKQQFFEITRYNFDGLIENRYRKQMCDSQQEAVAASSQS